MAEFSKLVITSKGQALMAKMIAGKGNIDFTKVCASDSKYRLEQLEALTSLSGVKQTSLISKVTRTNEVAIKIETAFTNTDLKVGYHMNTLGLYAIDPDAGEILYAVTIESSGSNYMPAYNGITVSGAYVQLVTTVGNADNVSLQVAPGAVATIGDIKELEKKIADLEAFVGYTSGDIYGVEVDFANKKFTRLAGAVNRSPGVGFDGIKAFGGRKRCNVTNEGKVAAYYGEAGFSTTGKLTQRIDRNDPEASEPDPSKIFEAGTAVQVMVEQPKFYYKVVPLKLEQVAGGKGYHMRKARYYVSDTPKAGFKLHPAFIENGNENDKIYLSAFEGTLWDTSASAYILDDAQVADFGNDMLSSIAGAKPISGATQSLTRANTRKIAQKRGKGWEQAYIATSTATELLMLIEYASFDMQKHIGSGNVNKPWLEDGVNYSEYTGATVSLGNASGAVTNDNGIQIVSYRGEENPYGNIWKWVDGINVYNYNVGSVHIADHGFADDTKVSPYKDAGITICDKSGYVSAFAYNEEFDWLFIASEVNGNSSLPVGDYFYQNKAYSGYTVAALGGYWDDGSAAGAFGWSLDDASSARYRYFGGRLVYVPSKNTAA